MSCAGVLLRLSALLSNGLPIHSQDFKSTNDQKFPDLLFNKCPAIKETKEFTGRFKKLFQNKTEGTLTTWLEDIAKSNPEIKRFAEKVLRGYLKLF